MNHSLAGVNPVATTPKPLTSLQQAAAHHGEDSHHSSQGAGISGVWEVTQAWNKDQEEEIDFLSDYDDMDNSI
jgi:hypothetical protein